MRKRLGYQLRVAYFKAHLHADNRHVVQSGAICNSDAEALPFISCENALLSLPICAGLA
jgi:hypothetical protein